MIIDCHLHLPVIKKENFEDKKKRLISELDKNKVDYAIVIPDNEENSLIGDLNMVLRLTENEKRLFILGTIDIKKDTKKHLKQLEKLFKESKILGIKIFPGHDPIYPTDKRLIPVYKLCLKYNLPIMIHTGWNSNNQKVAKYNDPKYITEIAKNFPELKIIISHYFWPEIEYCYNLTKSFKNIYFDTSALADKEVIMETGKEKIKKILEKTVKDNKEKVLFGSDYSCCGIKEHIDLVNSLSISKEEKERIFSRNAIKLFKLKNIII